MKVEQRHIAPIYTRPDASLAPSGLVEALESIRVKLSYEGQDACTLVVAQSNLNLAYHEVCKLQAALAQAPPAGLWQSGDAVQYHIDEAPAIPGTFIGYVGGWCDIKLSDGSMATVLPSRLTAQPGAGGER